MTLLGIPDCLLDLAERVGPVDDRADLAILDEACERLQELPLVRTADCVGQENPLGDQRPFRQGRERVTDGLQPVTSRAADNDQRPPWGQRPPARQCPEAPFTSTCWPG
jgi:hypothetical protein